MTGKLVQKTGTSESLPQLLPKQQLESLLWEFNCTGELSLLCFNVSLTVAVNVGSGGTTSSAYSEMSPKCKRYVQIWMQNSSVGEPGDVWIRSVL